MDGGTEASLQYDLTCLAASILLLSGIELADIHTREDARSQLAMRTGLHFFIAALRLNESVVDVDEIWEKCKTMVKVSLPSANRVVDLDELWPKNEQN